jgi:hypothetical protein
VTVAAFYADHTGTESIDFLASSVTCKISHTPKIS